jgi:hypothetical protein
MTLDKCTVGILYYLHVLLLFVYYLDTSHDAASNLIVYE